MLMKRVEALGQSAHSAASQRVKSLFFPNKSGNKTSNSANKSDSRFESFSSLPNQEEEDDNFLHESSSSQNVETEPLESMRQEQSCTLSPLRVDPKVDYDLPPRSHSEELAPKTSLQSRPNEQNRASSNSELSRSLHSEDDDRNGRRRRNKARPRFDRSRSSDEIGELSSSRHRSGSPQKRSARRLPSSRSRRKVSESSSRTPPRSSELRSRDRSSSSEFRSKDRSTEFRSRDRSSSSEFRSKDRSTEFRSRDRSSSSECRSRDRSSELKSSGRARAEKSSSGAGGESTLPRCSSHGTRAEKSSSGNGGGGGEYTLPRCSSHGSRRRLRAEASSEKDKTTTKSRETTPPSSRSRRSASPVRKPAASRSPRKKFNSRSPKSSSSRRRPRSKQNLHDAMTTHLQQVVAHYSQTTTSHNANANKKAGSTPAPADEPDDVHSVVSEYMNLIEAKFGCDKNQPQSDNAQGNQQSQESSTSGKLPSMPNQPVAATSADEGSVLSDYMALIENKYGDKGQVQANHPAIPKNSPSIPENNPAEEDAASVMSDYMNLIENKFGATQTGGNNNNGDANTMPTTIAEDEASSVGEYMAMIDRQYGDKPPPAPAAANQTSGGGNPYSVPLRAAPKLSADDVSVISEYLDLIENKFGGGGGSNDGAGGNASSNAAPTALSPDDVSVISDYMDLLESKFGNSVSQTGCQVGHTRESTKTTESAISGYLDFIDETYGGNEDGGEKANDGECHAERKEVTAKPLKSDDEEDDDDDLPLEDYIRSLDPKYGKMLIGLCKALSSEPEQTMD